MTDNHSDTTLEPTVLLNGTYEVWDEESLEIGETDDSGFLFEDQPHTFEELVRLLEGLTPSDSSYPASGWFTEQGSLEPDGCVRNKSYHLCRGQSQEAVQLWERAVRAVGFVSKGKTK
ncbi:hypothetical protein LC612_30855 [Nostoc sp. CHAB 5834]|nr:hypothetical protein [Nostoc sp. CHAB 5834]